METNRTTAASAGTVASPGTISPPDPTFDPTFEPVPALDPRVLAGIAALRVDIENWVSAGRALVDRADGLLHDTARK